MTFEQAYEFTKTIGSPTSYDDDECRLLWDTAAKLHDGSVIVEIGCEFGRSTSLLAQAAKERGHCLTLIDPFVNNVELDPGPKLVQMLLKVTVPFTLHCMRMEEAYERRLPLYIDLVHIDGDHETKGIKTDCALLLPRVFRGGYAVFHDYGRESLPNVKPIVDKATAGWEDLGTVGTCHAVRKP